MCTHPSPGFHVTLQDLCEDLSCPEVLVSRDALVAYGVVNSLCNSLLETDGGALNGELFSGRSVGHAVGLSGLGMYVTSLRWFWLCSYWLVGPAGLLPCASLGAAAPSSLCEICPKPKAEDKQAEV